MSTMMLPAITTVPGFGAWLKNRIQRKIIKALQARLALHVASPAYNNGTYNTEMLKQPPWQDKCWLKLAEQQVSTPEDIFLMPMKISTDRKYCGETTLYG